jgi:hypothetical protein
MALDGYQPLDGGFTSSYVDHLHNILSDTRRHSTLSLFASLITGSPLVILHHNKVHRLGDGFSYRTRVVRPGNTGVWIGLTDGHGDLWNEALPS